ncbi:MAG TPA: hypothetical protein DEA22_12575, partial [Blastocatellia bacterium]|nr:hypothetical protein [Blastocatellia bacterium]
MYHFRPTDANDFRFSVLKSRVPAFAVLKTHIRCLNFGLMSGNDETWMRVAIAAAVEARELGEVPVGACIVDAEGNVISAAGNRT